MRPLPSIPSAIGLTPPFDDDIPSNAGKVRIDFHCSQPRLRTTDRDQYYAIATATILFYDFLLTLGDEVSHVISVSFATFIFSCRERSNTLGREGSHGVRRENRLSYGIR